MIICLTGPTCSGKTTLAKYMEKEQGYERIITYTTRPPREGEMDGVDYHFIHNYEYHEKKHDGFFIETTSYNVSPLTTWWYGSALKDYFGESPKVVVLEPDGVTKIKLAYPEIDMFVVYLDIDLEVCVSRAQKRGDNPEEVKRRILADVNRFESFKNSRFVNSIITPSAFETPEDIYCDIIRM